jgi:hypothetical protein
MKVMGDGGIGNNPTGMCEGLIQYKGNNEREK